MGAILQRPHIFRLKNDSNFDFSKEKMRRGNKIQRRSASTYAKSSRFEAPADVVLKNATLVGKKLPSMNYVISALRGRRAFLHAGGLARGRGDVITVSCPSVHSLRLAELSHSLWDFSSLR